MILLNISRVFETYFSQCGDFQGLPTRTWEIWGVGPIQFPFTTPQSSTPESPDLWFSPPWKVVTPFGSKGDLEGWTEGVAATALRFRSGHPKRFFLTKSWWFMATWGCPAGSRLVVDVTPWVLTNVSFLGERLGTHHLFGHFTWRDGLPGSSFIVVKRPMVIVKIDPWMGLWD